MGSQFEETIRRAREKGAAKLKVIAPRLTPPSGSSFGRPRSGSGGGRSSSAQVQAATKARLAREASAREAAAAAAQRTTATRAAEKARAQLIAREAALRNKRARVVRRQSRDARTGDKLFIVETSLGSEKIRKITNRTTGEITINSFGVGKDGGGVRFKGGVVTRTKSKEEKEFEKFQKDLKEGKIKGFSGTGLSPSEMTKRQLLIDIGVLKKQSSKNIFQNVDPLTTEFFTDTRPTKKDSANFIKFLKREQLSTITKPKLNNLQRLASRMNDNLNRIRKAKTNQEKILLTRRANKSKKEFILQLARLSLIPTNATKRQASMFALGFSSSVLGVVGGLPSLPGAAVGVAIKTPGAVRRLPGATKKLVKKVLKDPKSVQRFTKKQSNKLMGKGIGAFKILVNEPGFAIGKIGAELFLFKGTGKALRVTGKVTGAAANKISPFIVKPKNGKLKIRGAPQEQFLVKGKLRLLKERVKKPSIRRPFSSVSNFLKGRKVGQFKKFTKDPGIVLKFQTVKSGARKLSEQVKLAGKEVTAVNAAADQLTTWIRRRKIIRKPIPGEDNFPVKIRNQIQKFDDGKKLTTKEFAEVNLYLQKNVAPNITLLERSLYLDPDSGLRISRLGIGVEKTASLRDILTGNFKFKKGAKPQITVVEKAIIEKIPKSIKAIEKKFKKDKKLTTTETNKLIEWQVKKSGKFKPIGSTIYAGGTELEITLAPGEILKRIKKAKTVLVEGKSVPVVLSKIYKPKPALLKKIKQAQSGKMAKAEVKKLEKLLSKETGNKIKIETPKKTKTSVAKIKPVFEKKVVRFSQLKLRINTAKLKRKFNKDKITTFGLRNLNKQDEFLKLLRKFNKDKITNKELKRLNSLQKFIIKKFPGKKVKVEKLKTPKELKSLKSKLKKETGFDNKVRRRGRKPVLRLRPPVRPPARLPKRPPKRSPKRSPTRPPKRPPARPPKRPPVRPPKRPPKRPPVRPPTRPPKRPPVRPPKRPPTRPPAKPPVTIRGRRTKIKKKKAAKKPQPVFNVFGKSGKKFVKLNVKPLTRRDALSKGAFAIDRTTSKTFKIQPAGKTKKPGSLLKNEKNYFNRQGFKLREVKIKKGRKFKLKLKYIEKTKYGIDTKTEKSGLTIAKLIKQRSKRKITPTQKKVMLKNLAKARRVKSKKLKGGRKK